MSSRFRLHARHVLASLIAVGILSAGVVLLGTSSVHAQDVSTQRTGSEVQSDTISAGRFDDGRMWTFDAPPLDYFENEYGFRPNEQWMEHARLGTLRIPGCTASLVSANGLTMTNHHCARGHATKVGESGEQILKNGFYATSLGEERRVPDLYADQLVEITDVTDAVDRAMQGAETAAERSNARAAAVDSIEQALVEQAGGEGYHAEVISLYSGAKFSGYTFRRYTDVRLVFLPEQRVGYFGGDTDNFTYPRYVLDLSLFRVYDDQGEPLQPEHYFEWSTEGSRPGDPVFVVGNPGSTLRLETHEQLAFRRDVRDKGVKQFLASRVEALKTYAETTEGTDESLQNTIFSLQNGLKLYRGRVEALNDDYVMARIQAGDQQFRDAIQADSSLRATYGGVFDSLAAIQQDKREWGDSHLAFLLLTHPSYSSSTLRRALAVRTAGDNLGGERLEQVVSSLEQTGGQPDGIDRALLTARLQDFVDYFGEDSDIVQSALGGAAPRARADAILSSSVFASVDDAVAAVRGGSIPSNDPALGLVDAFFDRFQAYQSAWSGLSAKQEQVAAQLGRARFDVYGTDVPPDATFSLRLADGVVSGYEYNGTRASAYTTFYGMLGHHHAYGADSEWGLPERWLDAPSTFERSTPINMVSTNDITGGNSGSPLLNESLEVVGLIFDGNIESLAGDYIFLPGRMRAVSVDVRGMLEALDEIYDADRLVQEVTGGAFVESEAAATESR